MLVIKKQNHTRINVLLPEIKAMLADGKLQREVAEYYGFRDKQVVSEHVVKRQLMQECR